MKLGLVMEGGAMRGLFTAGVIDVFMEKGIDFDGAVGVSAGATFGCNFKSRQIGRALRYNCKYSKDPRYGTLRSYLKTGNFFDVDFCYHELPDKLDVFDADTFLKNPLEFYVVATDLESGEPVYHKCYDGKEKDLSWICASASIPIVSKMVEIDGKKLLDGGIADSVPLKFFERTGYERNVVILTQPDSYRKKPQKSRWLCKILYRKFPRFVASFSGRYIMYNDTIDYVREAEKKGSAFVIRPAAALDVKSAEKDPEKLKKAYEEGRAAALEAINERGLNDWISKVKNS